MLLLTSGIILLIHPIGLRSDFLGIPLAIASLMCVFSIFSSSLKNLWDAHRAKNRRRVKKLAQWADSKCLSFSTNRLKKINETNIKNYRNCSHCNDFRACYAFNITSGTLDKYRICAFDYFCYLNNGLHLSAIVVETNLKLEPLFISPHCFIAKIADSARFSNINFESTEFNNQFHVQSSDRRWAYDVVNQATMELLLSSCRFNIEFNGNHVIAYRDELFEVGHFEEALQLLTGILDRLPESVAQELKERK